VVLDRLANALLDPYSWEGNPSGTEYVLEAERDDRHLLTAVDQHAYVRFIYAAKLQPPAASVDLVMTAHDLVAAYARRLVFAELALERVCEAFAPLRVELLIHYGSDWDVAPPGTAAEFRDPMLPTSRLVESQTVVEANMSAHGAADAAKSLITGTLRRLRWRRYESLVEYLTASLPTAVESPYATP